MQNVLADDELVHEMVSAICAAESLNNTRPWLQLTDSGWVGLHAEQDRRQLLADPRGRALYLSCGAALFGVRVAARGLGYRPLIRPQSADAAPSTLIAAIELAPGRPPTHAEHELLAALDQRLGARAPFRCRQLPDSVEVSLEQAAGFERASLRMLDTSEAALVLGLAEAAGQELGCAVDQTGRADTTGSADASASLLEPRLAVLTTARDSKADWLRAGQALERIVLAAARHGLTTSLLYQPIELHDLRDEPGWWPWPEQPQVIIRFGAEPGTEVPRAEAARPCLVATRRRDAHRS
jgi:hypothetical protein